MNAEKSTATRTGIMGERGWAFWPLMILCAVVSLLWVERAYWTYWPFEPLVIRSIEVKNAGNTVCAGSMMIYEMDITKNIDAPVKVRRQLVNSYLLDIPALEPPAKPLGDQIVPAYLDIPSFAEEGTYFMRWSADYSITPDRVVTVKTQTKPFKVVKCK